MKKRRVLSTLTALLLTMAMLLSMPLAAAADNVGEGETTSVADDEYVGTNNGTITTNEGTVETNNGTVTDNEGIVFANACDPETGEDGGTVVNNQGIVFINVGQIATDEDGIPVTGDFSNRFLGTGEGGATVENNYGAVGMNIGTVENNYLTQDEDGDFAGGGIELNTGKVTNNAGIVILNEGTVVNNQDHLGEEGGLSFDYALNDIPSEDAEKLHLDSGTVLVNIGEVTANDGIVYGNFGDVAENNGTVMYNISISKETPDGSTQLGPTSLKLAGNVAENYGTVTNFDVTEMDEEELEDLKGQGITIGAGTIGDENTVLFKQDENGNVEKVVDVIKEAGTFHGVQGDDGSTITLVQVKDGTTVGLDAMFNPTKDGYTLTGYVDANGKVYAVSDKVTFLNPMKFIAQWLKNVIASDDDEKVPTGKQYGVIVDEVVGGKFTVVGAEEGKIVRIFVDGKVVDAENYTLSTDAKGVVVTFTEAYLATLTPGNHNVWVTLTDGGAGFVMTI